MRNVLLKQDCRSFASESSGSSTPLTAQIWRLSARLAPEQPPAYLQQAAINQCSAFTAACRANSPSQIMHAVAAPQAPPLKESTGSNFTLLCTIATAATVQAACQEVAEAGSSGASAIELRLDHFGDFDVQQPDKQLQQLVAACKEARLVSIFTLRPHWEGCAKAFTV